MKIIFGALAIFFYSFNLKAQVNQCDTLYLIVDSMPEYPGGAAGLMKFAIDSLSIEFSCLKHREPVVSKIFFEFTITTTGEVQNVKVVRPLDIEDKCKTDLESVFYKMKKWQPRKLNGVPVCVRVNFPVNCIKWQ